MLYLVQSGETQADLNRILIGQADTKLSALGQQQADAAFERLEYKQIDTAFVPFWNPTWITFKTIQYQTRFPISESYEVRALLPRSGGDYEGRSYKDLRKELPPRKYRLWERDFFEAPPLGESYQDVSERVLQFFREHVVPLHEANKDVLIVVDPEVMRIILGAIHQTEDTEIPQISAEPGMLYEYQGDLGHV